MRRSHKGLVLTAAVATLTLSFGGAYVVMSTNAYTNPSANPPNNNTIEPLNIGTTAQTKQGDLGAGTFFDADDTNYFLNPTGLSLLKGTQDPTDSTRTIALDINNSIIENVKDPQRDQDVATKAYVDGVVDAMSGGGWLENLELGVSEKEFFGFPVGQFDNTDIYFDGLTGNEYIIDGSGSFGVFHNRFFDLPDMPVGCAGCWPLIAGMYANKLIVLMPSEASSYSQAGTGDIFSYNIDTKSWALLFDEGFYGTLGGTGATIKNDQLYVTSNGLLHVYDLETITKVMIKDLGINDIFTGLAYNKDCRVVIGPAVVDETVYIVAHRTNSGIGGMCYGASNNSVVSLWSLNELTYDATFIKEVVGPDARLTGHLLETLNDRRIALGSEQIIVSPMAWTETLSVWPWEPTSNTIDAEIELHGWASNIRPGIYAFKNYIFSIAGRQNFTNSALNIGVLKYEE